jgi:hypothetical protein
MHEEVGAAFAVRLGVGMVFGEVMKIVCRALREHFAPERAGIGSKDFHQAWDRVETGRDPVRRGL